MAMRPFMFLLSVLACHGAAVESPPPPPPTQLAPIVLPTRAPPVQSVVAAPSSVCLAPVDNKDLDPKYSAKAVDPQQLTHVDDVPDPVERDYARARLSFEANRWVDAATGFRKLAFEHPDHDVGVYAAQLYLECLNILGSQAHRSECYDDIAADVPRIVGLYCTARRRQNEDSCGMLDKIQADLDRLRAEKTITEADKTSDTNGYLSLIHI